MYEKPTINSIIYNVSVPDFETTNTKFLRSNLYNII